MSITNAFPSIVLDLKLYLLLFSSQTSSFDPFFSNPVRYKLAPRRFDCSCSSDVAPAYHRPPTCQS